VRLSQTTALASQQLRPLTKPRKIEGLYEQELYSSGKPRANEFSYFMQSCD
jgi:hypothetical protein